jgi:hypothetical protein
LNQDTAAAGIAKPIPDIESKAAQDYPITSTKRIILDNQSLSKIEVGSATGPVKLENGKAIRPAAVPIQRSFKPAIPLTRLPDSEARESRLEPNPRSSLKNIFTDRLALDMPVVNSTRPAVHSGTESNERVFKSSSNISQTSQAVNRSVSSSRPAFVNQTLNAPVIQRGTADVDQDVNGNGPKPDLRALARELYPLIKRMIIIDKERLPR